MTRRPWEDGLRLDDAPGPAEPIGDLEAERMIQRALESFEAPPRVSFALRWGWSAAAAVALIVLAPTALAAIATVVWPGLLFSPPNVASEGGGDAAAGSRAPDAADLGVHLLERTTDDDIPSAPIASGDFPTLERRDGKDTSAGSKQQRGRRRRARASEGKTPSDRERKSGERGSRRPTIHGEASEREALEGALPPVGRAPGSWSGTPSKRSRRPVGPSASELLTRANQLRAAKAYEAATEAYAEIRRRFAGSGPAYVAAVAEGELELQHGRDPRTALEAFEAARRMRPDGPLDAEARFGRGSALWALGRRARAERAWRALIDRYPHSAPARRARARLETHP